MSRGISLAWSDGVSDHEAQVMVQAIDHVIRWLYLRHPSSLFEPPLPVQAFGNWIIPSLVDSGTYWGTQWYIDSSFDASLDRIVAPTYLELIRREPWQRIDPHYDLVMLHHQLTEFPAQVARLRPKSYALGTSHPGTAAVVSVHQVRRVIDEDLRDRVLARLVIHHLGHVLGVPSFNRTEHVMRRGLEMHCTNQCVMRHASTIEQLVDLTKSEAEEAWPFCEECTKGLHSVVVEHSFVWS